MIIKRNKNKNVDRITLIIGLCLPIVSLPQLYDVWISKQTKGVSLITWSFFAVQAAIFAWFAIRHKEKPLIFTYVPLCIVELAIVIGVIVNG